MAVDPAPTVWEADNAVIVKSLGGGPVVYVTRIFSWQQVSVYVVAHTASKAPKDLE